MHIDEAITLKPLAMYRAGVFRETPVGFSLPPVASSGPFSTAVEEIVQLYGRYYFHCTPANSARGNPGELPG